MSSTWAPSGMALRRPRPKTSPSSLTSSRIRTKLVTRWSGSSMPAATIVDPVGLRIVRAVAGLAGLQHLALVARQRVLADGPRALRTVLEAVEQVVLDRAREDHGRVADIADAPAEHRLRLRREVQGADRDAAARRLDQPRQEQGKLLLAAAGRADDRDVAGQVNAEGHTVQHVLATIAQHRDVAGPKLAAQRRNRLRLLGLRPLVLAARAARTGSPPART